jgi:hypothetical protein
VSSFDVDIFWFGHCFGYIFLNLGKSFPQSSGHPEYNVFFYFFFNEMVEMGTLEEITQPETLVEV